MNIDKWVFLGSAQGEISRLKAKLVDAEHRAQAAEANTLTPKEIDRILHWYGKWSPVSVEDDELADKLYEQAKLERIAEGDKCECGLPQGNHRC